MKTDSRNNIEKVRYFFSELNIDNLYLNDFVNDSDINSELTYEKITNMLNDNNAFDIDIIYYSNAIKYLAENDNSLNRSLNLAAELCYDPSDLSSEILASLLASDILRDEWCNKGDEITEFLESLEW